MGLRSRSFDRDGQTCRCRLNRRQSGTATRELVFNPTICLILPLRDGTAQDQVYTLTLSQVFMPPSRTFQREALDKTHGVGLCTVAGYVLPSSDSTQYSDDRFQSRAAAGEPIVSINPLIPSRGGLFCDDASGFW